MDQWEDLERRITALEAAAAPAPQPEPPDDRLTYLTNWIVGFTVSVLTRDHVESLARALLTRPEMRRVLAPAPMAWPELPELPSGQPAGQHSSDFLAGWILGWRQAGIDLAAMNPARQEGQGNG